MGGGGRGGEENSIQTPNSCFLISSTAAERSRSGLIGRVAWQPAPSVDEDDTHTGKAVGVVGAGSAAEENGHKQ